MLLFKGHPESVGKTQRKYKSIPMSTKQEIVESIRSGMHGYKGYQMRGREITGLFMDAVQVHAFLTLMNYKRILVVTSYEDSKYGALTRKDFFPIGHAGDHMLPLVHHFNKSDAKMYVTKVKNGESIFSQLYDKFEIPSVNVDSYYKLGSKFKTKTNVKFDAVVLLGNSGTKKGAYQANKIKAEFAPYCKEDFDLIDVYRGDISENERSLSQEFLTFRNLKGSEVKVDEMMGHRHGYKTVVSLRPWDFANDNLFVRARDNLAWNKYMRIF